MYHSNSHFSSSSMLVRYNVVTKYSSKNEHSHILFSLTIQYFVCQCSGLNELNEEAELYVVVL